MKIIKLYCISLLTIIIVFTTGYSANAQVDNWLQIIKQTKVAIKYFAPAKSGSFILIESKDTRENKLGLIKEFSDGITDVKLTFTKFDSHFELSGEASSIKKEDLCFTLKIIFPLENMAKNVIWGYDLDSTEAAASDKKLYSNYIDVSTVFPPDGAFNTEENANSSYNDKLGIGQMSFYPLAAVSTGNAGFGWGVDMGIPLVLG